MLQLSSGAHAFRLGGGEVHCWHAALDVAPGVLARLQGTLSPAERERSSRLRFDLDRRRYIAAHAALRALLARYLRTRPERIEFVHNAFGKPDLHPTFGAALRFNLSHSAGLALVGIVAGCEIGIDVEALRAHADDVDMAELLLSATEATRLSALPRPQRTRAFLTAWTLQEARLKARGIGFGAAWAAPVAPTLAPLWRDSPTRSRPARVHRGAEAGWTLLRLAPAPGYIGAAAIAGRMRRCICRPWVIE